jgi:phytoene dehydrogenase-like protein
LSGRTAVVVGAGVGGLAAALRLARAGFRVRVLEARAEPGGLASGFEAGGLSFDGGPYVLLDRPGLAWAFRELGLELSEHASLRPLDPAYEVTREDAAPVRLHASLDETAAGLDRAWPGSGARYAAWVRPLAETHRRLWPLLRVSRPGLLPLLRAGALVDLPFLLRPLGAVLARSGLPPPVADALGIWTHVAGQRLEEAPSLLALVPALVHRAGAYHPEGGMAAIPRALAAAARRAGVLIELRAEVRRIVSEDGRAAGVETADGRFVAADAVVSNAGGPATYLRLVADLPSRVARGVAGLPLQSPGVCAYLAVRGSSDPPLLRFRLPRGGRACRLLVRTGAADPARRRGEWWPARLIAPMRHAEAERLGAAGQAEFLEGVLSETWWREGIEEHRVVARRVPAGWGAEFRLHREGMNPAMTSRLMRRGRMPHRSPHLRGLYLAGSSTHPGQWVSFCAISGILAADCVRDDLG